MRIFIPLSLFAVLVFASEDGSNETLNDVEPETTKKFIHGEGGQDTTDSSGTIDLSRIDIVSPINMGLIKGGLNIKIPKDNYVMIPYMGVRISASSNFFPIYTSKVGECVTFTEDAQFDVVFDSKGCPMIVDGQGNIFSGYREDNGRIINGNPNDQFVTKKFDQSTIIAECENLGPRMTDLGVKFLQSSNEYWPVFYETVTGDLKSFNQDGDIIKVFVDESGCPLTIDDDGLIIPGYKLKGGVEYEASTKTVVLEKPHLNVRDILAKINSVGRSNPAFWLLHAQKGYSASNKEAITPTAQFGIGINFANLNLQGSLGMGLINVNNLGYIPKGYVIVPGMGVKVSTQGSYKPVIVNKWGEAFAISDYGSDLLNVYFDPSSIPVTQGLQVDIPFGYIALPNSGVRLARGGAYFNVYADRGGNLCVFDDNGDKISVHLDEKGIPCVIGKSGNIYGGYKLVNGRNVEANLASKLRTKVVDISVVTTEIEEMGSCYEEYYTLHRPQMNSVNSLFTSNMHHLETGRPQSVNYEIFTQIKTTTKINIASMYNFKGVNLGKIDQKSFNVPIPKNYVMIPHVGVRLSAYSQSYFPIYISPYNSQTVAFNQDGEEVVVEWDENGNPLALGENNMRFAGYREINNVYKYAKVSQKTYKPRVFNYDQVVQEVESLGPKCINYLTIHNPKVNITINHNYGPTKKPKTAKTTPIQMRGRPGVVTVTEATTTTTTTTTTPRPIINLNTLLRVNYMYVDVINCFGNITGGLPCRSPNRNFVAIPGMGVSFCDDYVYHPIYLNIESLEVIGLHNNLEVPILFDTDSGAPVSYDSASNTYWPGFIMIDGKMVFSTPPKGNYLTMKIDAEIILSKIEELGKSYPGYYTKHQRRNLRDTLEEILKGLTVTSSLQYITPLAFDLPICNETRYTMLPGFGCQINADSEYYPIYLDDKGRAYVFNLEGSSLEVFFDGEGAPLIFSSDGRTTHSGFFIKNGVPEFSANAHGYIVVIGMSVRIDQTKRYWNPVFVNKHGALVAIDSSGNVINLVTDSQGIPVIKKGILLEGRISRNGVIETSATYSRTYVPKIDVEIVKTHLTRMGPNFIFYNNLYPRVDISSILQEILDKLTLETAVCSLINTGIDGNKLERRGYYALPGFGISADGTENYSPIFVTQGGSIVTFDHLTDQLIQVVLDHHGMPAVIDSATSEIRKGFAIIEGKPKYALSEGKFVNSKVDVNIVIKTIERLGYECPYYLSVFPAIELSSILPNIFLSLTPENAALYIEDDFELPPDSKYVLVPGIGTKTRDSGEKFRHCYVDDKGLLFSFDANKEPVEVYQDIFGVVFTKYETKVYEGFILLNQKQKLSITVGKVRIPIIDRNQVVACNNRLGVNFMKGYSSCNKKIDIASILPEILNSLDATLAHGAINAGLYENVPMEYYALGGFGIKYEVNSTTKIYPIYCHQGKLVLVDEQSTVYECLQDIQGAPLVEIDGTFHRGYYEYLGKRVFATIGGKFNSIQVETNIVINSLLKIGPNYFGWLTVKRPLNLLEDFEKIMGALTLENSIAQIEYEETPVPSGYIQLPGFAVKTTPNGKFTPVYVDKSGYLKAFNEEGTPIKVVFDCQNIPISISECNTILQGFVIIDGSHRYSVTSGKTKQIELNLAIIIETIDRLGPDHPAYLSLHPPIDLKDLEDIMDSMTLENSMRLINPVGLTVHIPPNMYCMIPGMGVALDNSKNYYPIWIDKQTRKCVVFSNEGLIQTINFDEGGVPVVNTISIDGSEQVYGGFVVYKNKTRFSTKFSKFRDITLSYDPIFKACNRLGPSYHGFKYLYPEIPVQNELGRILEALNVRLGLVNSGIAHNVPKNYYLIPGFGTTIEENSKNIYPLYINEDDESVCTFVDSESPPIDVWFDLQNLPRVENDIGTFAGKKR
uniref:WG repeat-containing protein n=1 Tax=Rhabditophanes sp. KR3021 TaxID=114890 RepID=A0AC35UHG4_9BILA